MKANFKRFVYSSNLMPDNLIEEYICPLQ